MNEEEFYKFRKTNKEIRKYLRQFGNFRKVWKNLKNNFIFR